MSLTKYQIFLTVADCGSFTRCAELMNFTQSGVSHAISSLEEELGVSLLCRGKNGVSLTADGRTLLPQIQEICTLQHHLEETAQDLSGLGSGLVRIASFDSVALQWLPYILKTFNQRYPGIKFEVLHTNDNRESEEWLASGLVDCAFVSNPGTLGMDSWTLHSDEWLVITSKEHPYADSNEFPLDILASDPFIQLNEGKDFEIGAIFKDLKISPCVCYTILQDQAIMAMVSQGLGISLMPELMLEHSPYPLGVSRLFKRYSRDIMVMVKNKSECSLSTMRFVEHARRWVQNNYLAK